MYTPVNHVSEIKCIAPTTKGKQAFHTSVVVEHCSRILRLTVLVLRSRGLPITFVIETGMHVAQIVSYITRMTRITKACRSENTLTHLF